MDFSPRRFHSDDLINDIDEYVISLGLKKVGHGWRLISGIDAVIAITHILSRSLCYGSELLPEPTAKEAAEFFIHLFANDATQFVTNCDVKYLGRSGFSWTPLTDSTGDVGVVGVDAKNNGIICIEDED